MNCEVVRDLIPLFIDDCCSPESAAAVQQHIADCPQCKAVFESMKAAVPLSPPVTAHEKLHRVNEWKASALQSALLFASFALITAGVALEAATPSGITNGWWAVSLVIPAAGFMLSLANWYFVRLYKSKKSFTNCSALITAAITGSAYVWVGFHYDFGVCDFARLFNKIALPDFLEAAAFFGTGILLTAVFCVLSKTLSGRYARMLGKE